MIKLTGTLIDELQAGALKASIKVLATARGDSDPTHLLDWISLLGPVDHAEEKDADSEVTVRFDIGGNPLRQQYVTVSYSADVGEEGPRFGYYSAILYSQQRSTGRRFEPRGFDKWVEV